MLKNFVLYFVFVSGIMFCFAQGAKNINGKIIVKDGSAADVLVLNLNTEQETKSDIDGKFTIQAKIDDLIVFQSNSLEIVRKSIEDNDYLKAYFEIKMIPKPEQLDEVKIFNYSYLNAVSLGILSKPAKTFTVAERRLFQASVGGGIMVLMNALNGKTKMLKKYVAFEKIERRVAKINDMFTREFYIKTVEIPEDQVARFVTFAAEEESVIKLLSSKNKYLIGFELVKLAPKFKKLQNED
ncbi:MAG: hypothetical protein RLZZ312_165 [Bacteroidota bacterium]|jgi:hypothetical protein